MRAGNRAVAFVAVVVDGVALTCASGAVVVFVVVVGVFVGESGKAVVLRTADH